MYKLNHVLLRISLLLAVVQGLHANPLLFDNITSTLKINPGATLSITSPVSNFNGTLIKSSGGAITGNLINFADGIFQDEGNELLLRGVLNPVGSISLTGNNRFKAAPGMVLQSVDVSKQNNILEGAPLFSRDLTLADSNTSLLLDLQSEMNKNIILNSGNLKLNNDLRFSRGKNLVGAGSIEANGHQIVLSNQEITFNNALSWKLNSNIVLHALTNLCGAFTFYDIASVNGNGNILDLSNGGELIVAPNSTLHLSNLTLRGVRADSLKFGNEKSTVQLSNVSFEVVDDLTTSQGNVIVDDNSVISLKNYKWIFEKTAKMTVRSKKWFENLTESKPSGNVEILQVASLDPHNLLTRQTPEELQSQIDVLFSRVDILDTCCSQLSTSTGFLQSQIDELEFLDCCAAEFLTSVIETNAVRSTDWSFDNKFAALGMNNNLLGDTNVLKIYEFNGTNLALRDQHSFLQYRSVSSVRWHPTKYLVAVARLSLIMGDAGLQIFQVNPVTGILTPVVGGAAEFGRNVKAIAWHPSGNYVAVTRTGSLLVPDEIAVYSVSATGMLTGPIVTANTGGLTLAQRQALDFDKNGQFLAVGLALGLLNQGLKVYEFNAGIPSLTLNASAIVEAIPGNLLSGSTVTAVSWNKSKTNTLALGIELLVGPSGQSVQVWEHNAGAGILTYKNGVSDFVGAFVNGVNFKSNGRCLSVAKTPIIGGSVQTFEFDSANDSLSLKSEHGSVLEGSAQDVRYSQDGDFIVDGLAGLTNKGSVLKSVCVPTRDCCSLIEILQSEIDVLRSQIEICCFSLNSKVDVLETCCDVNTSMIDRLKTDVDALATCCDINTSMNDMLKTSTGFLQSEIDYIASLTCISNNISLISRIQVLETCCDELRTSTGFLQSQLDACCSSLHSQVEQLETCCDELNSKIAECCCPNPCDSVNPWFNCCFPVCCPSDCEDLLSRIEELESCCDELHSRIEPLETCCESLTSRVDQLDSCCDALKTSTGILQTEIRSCCDALATSTGLLQSQLDECCSSLQSEVEALESCCQDLQAKIIPLFSCCDDLHSIVEPLQSCCEDLTSRVEVLETCCEQLKKTDERLQSQIDESSTELHSRIEELETCCEDLKGITCKLQKRLDCCCDNLDSKVGNLETCCAELRSIVEPFATSCEDLQGKVETLLLCCKNLLKNNKCVSDCEDLVSQFDSLKVSVKDLHSKIDPLETCCSEFEGRIKPLESCCDNLTSRFDRLNFADSQTISAYISDNYVLSRLRALESCCDELKSLVDSSISSDDVHTKIENLISCCDNIRGLTESENLLTRIEQLESCCRELICRVIPLECCCKTNSSMISMLKTSTGFLQSQIDVCCSTKTDCCDLISRIEALESCCDELICPPDDCCKVRTLTSANVENDVQTGDWSFDSRFIAIGLDNVVAANAGDILDPFVLKIYELVGSSLVLRAQTTIGSEIGEVTCVRWHPSRYRLAVGRKDIDDSDEHKLHIFDFNPNTFALTQKDSAEECDVLAVAWNPKSLDEDCLCKDEDVLAVGRDCSTGQLILYKVSKNGKLTGPIPQNGIDTEGEISTKALDWDKCGTFLVVGTKLHTDNKVLRVYEFNSKNITLSLNAVADVESVPGDPSTKSTALTVDWNPDIPCLIAVGLKGKGGQLAQVFEHKPHSKKLKHLCGIDNLGRSVRTLNWRDSRCLALGKAGGQFAGRLFRVYEFDAEKCTFALSSEFDDFDNRDIQEVRWSPDGSFVLNGSDINRLTVYKANNCKRVTICDLISIIEILETCCDINTSMIDMLKTSTGFLQSQIDACCISSQDCCFTLESRVDILDSCCDALRTSTGFLQSQIDACCISSQDCCFTLESRVDILDSCCDALRTSTGFLQSQIDACCISSQDCCFTLESRVDILDSCCDALRTSTGFLQSQIDACCISSQDCCFTLISRVDVLDSCCDALRTSTGFLQSQIDACCNIITPTVVIEDCIITVTGDLFLTPDLLPAPGTATVFRFSPCYGRMCGVCPQTPRVIVDPVAFGSNRIPLNKNTRIIFQGEGLVEVHDGIVWDYQGTPCFFCEDPDGMADWPALIIEDKARMTFCPNSTITFGGGIAEGTGAGKFIVRQDANMLAVEPSTHIIFGETPFTQILQIVEADGVITVGKINNGEDEPSTPMPSISYINGFFDLVFRNHSTLNVNNGIFELNTTSTNEATPWEDSTYMPGIIGSLTFSDGSAVRIVKTGDTSLDGLFRMAPNVGDTPVNFDNRAGIIFTSDDAQIAGNIQFVNFDEAGDPVVRTTLLIQNNNFSGIQSMLTIFNELTYIIRRGVVETPQATILVRLGNIENLVSNGLVVAGDNGRLAAYCPIRDGSIVQLCQGDRDVFYGVNNTVEGLTVPGNQTFIIRDCDAATRTPPPVDCGF